MLVALATLIYSYGNYDWHNGWGAFYRHRASESRRRALEPTVSESDREELRLLAEWDEIIAVKFSYKAYRPWAPGLRAPLLTEGDKLIAKERYRARYQLELVH